MADIVRQLTQEGIDAFRDYIDATRRGENRGPIPSHLLYGSPCSESLSQQVEIEQRQFITKYEAAVYFSRVFKNLDQEEISYNAGLWSWLGLYYLDELSRSNANGTRQLKDSDRYILAVELGTIQWGQHRHLLAAPFSVSRQHRHLLATPFSVYKRHGEDARMLLKGSVASKPELTSQIVERQQFSRSQGFIQLVNGLYYDGNGNTKSGSLARTKPGSLFRLFAVFQQLEVNYDIFNMTRDQMMKLLPPEFDEWLEKVRP